MHFFSPSTVEYFNWHSSSCTDATEKTLFIISSSLAFPKHQFQIQVALSPFLIRLIDGPLFFPFCSFWESFNEGMRILLSFSWSQSCLSNISLCSRTLCMSWTSLIDLLLRWRHGDMVRFELRSQNYKQHQRPGPICCILFSLTWVVLPPDTSNCKDPTAQW